MRSSPHLPPQKKSRQNYVLFPVDHIAGPLDIPVEDGSDTDEDLRKRQTREKPEGK